MKRKFIIGLIALLLSSNISSMASTVKAESPIEGVRLIYALEEKKEIEFEVVEDAIPEKFRDAIEACKYNKGYLQYEDKETKNRYIAILAGERPNPAYGIKVTRVEKHNDKLIINVKDVLPSPDMMVIQVIAYPYTVIKVKDNADFVVVDEEGKTYEDSRLRRLPEIKTESITNWKNSALNKFASKITSYK